MTPSPIKTKEELIQEHHFVQKGSGVAKSQHHADISIEYAELIAIGFAEWLMKNTVENEEGWSLAERYSANRYTAMALQDTKLLKTSSQLKT